MEFPLALIDDFLARSDYTVAAKPENLRFAIKWIALMPEAGGLSAQHDTLYITSSPRPCDDEAVLLVLNCNNANVTGKRHFDVTRNGVSCSDLVDELLRYLMSILDWNMAMYAAVFKRRGCAYLLELSQPVLGRFISISDSNFAHVAHTPDFEPLDDAHKYLLEHGEYEDDVIRRSRESGLSSTWTKKSPANVYDGNPVNPYPSIERIYLLSGQYAAHIIMSSESPITVGEEFLFGLLADAVGFALEQQWLKANPFKRPYNDFLVNLLNGEQGGSEELGIRADLARMPHTGAFRILLLDNLAKGNAANYVINRLIATVPESFPVIDEGKLVVAIAVEGRRAEKALGDAESRVFDIAEDMDMNIGASRVYHDLRATSHAYEEAKIALEYGRLHHREFEAFQTDRENRSSNRFFTFVRYFPFFVSDPAANVAAYLARQNPAREILGAIDQADAAKGTMDLSVLRAFLLAGGHVKMAAESIGMPRNSFIYRVDRMKRVYKLDLSERDVQRFLNVLFLLPR